MLKNHVEEPSLRLLSDEPRSRAKPVEVMTSEPSNVGMSTETMPALKERKAPSRSGSRTATAP